MSNVQPRKVLRPITGGTLDPQDVIGRDTLVAFALARLLSGQNLIVTDPRRMGKTSFLARLVLLARPRSHAIKIDFEGVTSAQEFFLQLCTGLLGFAETSHRVKKALTGVFESLEMQAGPLRIATGMKDRSATELLERVIASVDDQLRDDKKLLILALDEVPQAVMNIVARDAGGPAEANALLQILRKARGRPGSRLRWVITGSIGFHHVLRKAGSTEGAINDLEMLPCGPLDRGGATELSEALLHGISKSVTVEVTDALVTVSGAIPFLIQHLALGLENRNDITALTVAEEFDALLDDRDRSKAWTHLLTRIETHYERDGQDLAKKILDIAAQRPVSFDELHEQLGAERELLISIVDDLEDDHYLIQSDGMLLWRYAVLQKFWMRRRRLS
jgi:hypothetical protein